MPGNDDKGIKLAPSTSPLLKTTASLILLQLFSRLFSFSLNQLLLRSTTPQALGIATMGLEVVRDTSLFLVREGIRGAVVRNRSSKAVPVSSTSSQLVAQTLLVPTMLSPLVIVLFFVYSLFPPTPLPALFNATVGLYAASAVIELLAERWYLETLREWETMTGKRVRIEGAAVVTKAMGTLAAIMIGGERYSLLAFGVGQMIYSSTLLLGFWASVGSSSGVRWTVSTVKVVRGTQEAKLYLDPQLKDIGWALTKQSFVKQLLTEGDKIVVGRLSKVEDQGGYAVALNYGSLIARILFQPLEESSRLFFSRNLASPTPATLLASANLLSSILLLHTHLSLIFIFLAPAYTSPLLYHLIGPRWSYPLSSAPIILAAYCIYLPFLAINGVTEAFFQSVADGVWLQKGSKWMGFCSVAFVGAVVVGVKAGMAESGLVYANCVNMALRIAFSSYFIRHYFSTSLVVLSLEQKRELAKALSWKSWAPKLSTLVMFFVAGYAVRRSQVATEWTTFRGLGQHVAVGAVAGLACLGIIYWNERKSIAQLGSLLKRKQA